MATTETPERKQTIQRTVWFANLAHAVEKQRYQEAGHAMDELKNLGVIVKFKRPSNPTENKQ